MSQCENDYQCGETKVCKENICVPKFCMYNSECSENQNCINGFCSKHDKILKTEFSVGANINCNFPQNIFSTCLIKNDNSISRYISIALFALCVITLLILSGVFIWQNLFKQNDIFNGIGSVFIGIFVAITSYLSLQIVAFNVETKYVYFLVIFFILITVFLVFTIILFNRNSKDSQRYARGAAITALFAEFIFLIVAMISPNFAAADGAISQSVLITPIILLTLASAAYV
jgi:hypothetical protein